MGDAPSSDTVWRKSSRSGSTGGECVEVARKGPGSAVRDSKNPEGGFLYGEGRVDSDDFADQAGRIRPLNHPIHAAPRDEVRRVVLSAVDKCSGC